MKPQTYRSLLGLATRRPGWQCQACTRTFARRTATSQAQSSLPKRTQRTASTQAQSIPAMEQMQRLRQKRKAANSKNLDTLYYTLSIIIGTLAISYGSVPLYKTICQQTGWGGQPIKSAAHGGLLESEEDIATRVTPVTSSRRLRITFQGSTSDILPWKFSPQQRDVKILPGETALAFYTATNKSDEDIIGVATYSVTPAQVAPYFSKIQCFCFEEQRLTKQETVDMPVFFYIDPAFLEDPNMKNIDTITLNYTFFRARYDKDGHLSPMPMAM